MNKVVLRLIHTASFLQWMGYVLSQSNVATDALDLMRSGRYETAQEQLQSAAENTPLQLRLLIELFARRGDSEAVARLARQLVRRFREGEFRRPADLSQAAFAAWKLERWEEANQIYIQASRLEAAPLSLFVDWGRLYLEKYNPAEAEGIFRDALRAPDGEDVRWSRGHAHLGLAEALAEQGKSGVEQALAAAAEDPTSTLEVLAFQTDMALKEEDWEEASELIQQGLAVNAAYLPLLELNCGLFYLQGAEDEFEAARKQVREINPRDAGLLERLGDAEVLRRRLDVAIQRYEEALQLDPRSWSALASKGINLLRVGREEEGVTALELAYANDPYNIWTVNTLRLVDSFQRFDRFETEHFSVKLHRDEIAVLRSYVEPLIETCLDTLERRYDHRVEGKVVFEMYPDHDDFAVRTLGLPGLGALGATFGNVVAMDSPSARSAGEFHWASTLWHELAHVVTLSLSDNRVPRWFTEGLSVMEERQAGRGWGDSLSLGFVRAFESGKLLPLRELNSGFVRPRYPEQLAISYFQAGWVCELLVREFGMSKIREMLLAYREGRNTDEVFETVLGKSLDAVEELVQQDLSDTLGPLSSCLAPPEAIPKSEEELKAAASAEPQNYFLNFSLGRTLAESGPAAEAIDYLRRAIELFPSSAGRESPYPILAALYRQEDRLEEEMAIRRDWWRRAPLFVDNALRLAELLEGSSRSEEARSLLQETMYVDPFSEEAHTRLGHLYLELGEPKMAAREFQAVVELKPANQAEAHYQLADALYRSGAREAAKREVLIALESAPGWEQAQKLLLELVRQ